MAFEPFGKVLLWVGVASRTIAWSFDEELRMIVLIPGVWHSSPGGRFFVT
jgi:hypothetical protein